MFEGKDEKYYEEQMLYLSCAVVSASKRSKKTAVHKMEALRREYDAYLVYQRAISEYGTPWKLDWVIRDRKKKWQEDNPYVEYKNLSFEKTTKDHVEISKKILDLLDQKRKYERRIETILIAGRNPLGETHVDQYLGPILGELEYLTATRKSMDDYLLQCFNRKYGRASTEYIEDEE